jgi:beta-lactamase class A
MKRFSLLISFLSFCLIILISHTHTEVYAATDAPQINVADAVYADLAIRNFLDNVSIYYNDGKSVDEIRLNETRHWLPASTVKTYAAMYAYKLIADKKVSLSDEVTIDAKNQVPTELVTDELPTLLSDEVVTVDRLIRQMITQSDNTAFNVLLDVLGRDNITSYIQSLGMVHTHIGSKLNLDTSQEQYEFDVPGYGINTTTAEDYGLAFELIKNNKTPYAKELYAILGDQKINNMIPLFLPKNVKCAHKTGDLDPLYHDGGICRDEKQAYVLTVFTNAGDPNLVAHLSELVYTKNYDLVGENLTKNSISEVPQEQPIDSLVLNSSKTSVLGAQNTLFPVPDITAADLGVKANDLSLVIKSSDLPSVFIPADSPFHILSDAGQIIKRAFVLGPIARRNVDIATETLHLAEAKDLLARNKTKDAQHVLSAIQPGLQSLTKDITVKYDASAQNTILAISDTRFSILSDVIKNASGNQKLALIKDIATQARETVQTITPNIPAAANATNLSQKPLIGEIINKTSDTLQVKTSGGQIITIPLTSTAAVEEKKVIPAVVPTLNPGVTISPIPSVTPVLLESLSVKQTVALIGSSINNKFSPTLILTNIPKELAAPQPVTVVKVNTKNNTMVVVENGIYTQVNVNANTSIKGADTNVPLKEIKQGDIVVIHGEPLTQINPSPTSNPSIPTIAPKKESTNPGTGSITPSLNTSTNPGAGSITPLLNVSPTIGTIVSTPGTSSNKNNKSNTTVPVYVPSSVNSSGKNPTTPSSNASSSTGASSQPHVIQGTSIKIIEHSSPSPASQKSNQEQKHEEPHKSDQSKPQQSAPPPVNKQEQKKNK